jgi:hypothetical protein
MPKDPVAKIVAARAHDAMQTNSASMYKATFDFIRTRAANRNPGLAVLSTGYTALCLDGLLFSSFIAARANMPAVDVVG